jgi:hypothetical protein
MTVACAGTCRRSQFVVVNGVISARSATRSLRESTRWRDLPETPRATQTARQEFSRWTADGAKATVETLDGFAPSPDGHDPRDRN